MTTRAHRPPTLRPPLPTRLARVLALLTASACTEDVATGRGDGLVMADGGAADECRYDEDCPPGEECEEEHGAYFCKPHGGDDGDCDPAGPGPATARATTSEPDRRAPRRRLRAIPGSPPPGACPRTNRGCASSHGRPRSETRLTPTR